MGFSQGWKPWAFFCSPVGRLEHAQENVRTPEAGSNHAACRFGRFKSPEGRKQNSPWASARAGSPGLFSVRPLGAWNTHKKMSELQKQDRIMLLADLDVLNRPKGENRIADGLQPGLEALGCFLFARWALGTRTRKCPNSRSRIESCCLRIWTF